MADDVEDNVPPESIELRRFEMHSLWRVLLWGASAAMAVAIVAGTAYSDLGAERLQRTLASLIGPAKTETPTETQQPQIAQQATPQINPQQLAALEKQSRELTQTVRELTAERDRVKSRLASLEQNLDDITGTIKKQSAQIATQQTAAKQPAAPSSPPMISAPQTVAAIPSPMANSAAPPDTPITTAAVPPSPALEASPPLDGPIPLPPMRSAASEENTAAAVRELGIDVGGAASLDALRAHWAALKANVGPDVVGLAPSYVVRQRPSGGTDYRLVLGPLPNSATALRICAKLIAARANCRAGTFMVERLAERQRPVLQRATEQLQMQSRESILSR